MKRRLAERVGVVFSVFRFFANFCRWLLILSASPSKLFERLSGVFRCLRPIADFFGAMELEMELAPFDVGLSDAFRTHCSASPSKSRAPPFPLKMTVRGTRP
jgi:hypothetical protein